MIIPTTYASALMLTILTMICWGSWANTFKMTKKWRFELFYFDYAAGVLIAAVVAAFTFGSMGEELTFQDNLLIASKRMMLWGTLAGVVFNLANMLLVAAISISGMSVAFPIGIGLALVIGTIWSFLLNPQGNPYLLFGGAALVGVAIVVNAMAYRAHLGRSAGAANRSIKGIVISLVSGLLMGSFYPLVEMSKGPEIGYGLGPYTVGFFFAIGVFLSTLIFNLYFMNLPVQGEPVGLVEYFRGSAKSHLLGVFGGIIWTVGAIANFVAASAPKTVQLGPAISYALGQCATLVSVLWGLLVWKEFRGASTRVWRLIGLMIALFIGGVALLAIAPLFTKA
jgi:glucose uptake protein